MKKVTFRQGHALIIGVGADLPNTIADAEGLAKIIKDKERCAYPEGQVHLLTGEQATRTTILAALDQLQQQTKADTTLIIYFSGHGYQVSTAIGKAYFLMPYGYDAQALIDTAISGQEFMQKLSAISAQKVLLLLDCCHAGGMDNAKAPGAQFAKAPLPPEAQTLFAQGSGRVVIASSRADELSYAGKPYSAFTLALVEALAGQGVSAKDGYVRAADLALYAREMVPQRTQDKQHPVLQFERADNFVVAYYAAGGTEVKGLPYQGTPEIEPAPGAMTIFNQAGQTVHGPQTNIAGDVQGAVFSGVFQGPVTHAKTINTDGAAFIGGNVNLGGGDFIGRDKVVYGDDVRGDKIIGDKVKGDKYSNNSITVGNITGSTGVAIGRNLQTTVNTFNSGVSGDQVTVLFKPLLAVVDLAAPDKQLPAREVVLKLQAETTKGTKADDSVVAGCIQDVVAFVPEAAGIVVNLFAAPALASMTGPVTAFVLRRIASR